MTGGKLWLAEVEPGVVLVVQRFFQIGSRVFCTWRQRGGQMAGWLEAERVVQV